MLVLRTIYMPTIINTSEHLAPDAQTELPHGHETNHRCHKFETQAEARVACKVAETVPQQKAGVDEAIDENDAEADDGQSIPVDSRPPTSPASPRRNRRATTTTDGRNWCSGRSAGDSTMPLPRIAAFAEVQAYRRVGSIWPNSVRFVVLFSWKVEPQRFLVAHSFRGVKVSVGG